MPRNRQTQGARDPKNVAIGERIREARLRLGLEQKELGELVGLTAKSVSNHEIGEFGAYAYIPAYAAALGTSQTWLLRGSADLPDMDQAVKMLEASNRLLHSILDEIRLLRLDGTEGRGGIPH